MVARIEISAGQFLAGSMSPTYRSAAKPQGSLGLWQPGVVLHCTYATLGRGCLERNDMRSVALALTRPSAPAHSRLNVTLHRLAAALNRTGINDLVIAVLDRDENHVPGSIFPGSNKRRGEELLVRLRQRRRAKSARPLLRLPTDRPTYPDRYYFASPSPEDEDVPHPDDETPLTDNEVKSSSPSFIPASPGHRFSAKAGKKGRFAVSSVAAFLKLKSASVRKNWVALKDELIIAQHDAKAKRELEKGVFAKLVEGIDPVDLTGDGGVIKQTYRSFEGGDLPEEGGSVVVDYAGRLGYGASAFVLRPACAHNTQRTTQNAHNTQRSTAKQSKAWQSKHTCLFPTLVPLATLLTQSSTQHSMTESHSSSTLERES